MGGCWRCRDRGGALRVVGATEGEEGFESSGCGHGQREVAACLESAARGGLRLLKMEVEVEVGGGGGGGGGNGHRDGEAESAAATRFALPPFVATFKFQPFGV